MTELTLEELAEGARILAELLPIEPPYDDDSWVRPTPEFRAKYKAWLDWSNGVRDDRSDDKRTALLAMARELIRLRGALNYLDDAGATVIMKGRPQLRFATRPASVLFIAHDLGLVDPLSTPAAPVAEGGEG